MFWTCFIYDHKGLCHIYYLETPEQKAKKEEEIEHLNKEEIITKCCAAFDLQEWEKKRKWDKKEQKWPKKQASWEIYWKKNQYKKDLSWEEVDNIWYTYEVIKPHLIPFSKEIMK